SKPMRLRTPILVKTCNVLLKTTCLLLVPLFCGIAVAQQTSGRLTLNDVLGLAEQRNLDLAAARAKKAAALAGIAIAKERPNPTVTFSRTRDVPHESVVLDQPFELGLKRSKRIEVAKGETVLNDLETDTLARQIRSKTRQ